MTRQLTAGSARNWNQAKSTDHRHCSDYFGTVSTIAHNQTRRCDRVSKQKLTVAAAQKTVQPLQPKAQQGVGGGEGCGGSGGAFCVLHGGGEPFLPRGGGIVGVAWKGGAACGWRAGRSVRVKRAIVYADSVRFYAAARLHCPPSTLSTHCAAVPGRHPTHAHH